MPEDPIKIDGQYLQKDENGNWQKVEAPLTHKELVAPIRPPLDPATKIKRNVRDFTVPAGMLAGPIGLVQMIASMAQGKSPARPSSMDIPLGTGQARNVLTGAGGVAGMSAAGALGLPSGPGALAAAAAGYGIGATAGSGVAQGLEAWQPDLFQSGYAPERSPDVKATNPNISDAVSDAAISGAIDLGSAGVLSGTKLAVSKSARANLAEWLLTRRYNPAKKNALPSPLSDEMLNAMNANPDVPITTRDILPEHSVARHIQDIRRPDATARKIQDKTNKIFEAADRLKEDMTLRYGGDLPLPKNQINANTIGKAGLDSANRLEKNMTARESLAHTDINKFMTSGSASSKQIGTATGAKPLFGAMKLNNLQQLNKTSSESLDTVISSLRNDPSLAGEARIVKDKLNILGDGSIRDWATVSEASKQLGGLANNKNIPASLRSLLVTMDKALEKDIVENLGGSVKETAGYWKPGAVKQYEFAKKQTIAKQDMFPKEIQQAVKRAGGEVKSRPGERGGESEEFFRDIRKSPQVADRLAKSGGEDNARIAFFNSFLNEYTNANTKQIAGGQALADFESENTKAIAGRLMNQSQRQNLKNLLRLSEKNPAVSRFGPMVLERDQANTILNGTGAGVSVALGGNAAGFLKSVAKVSVIVGSGPFADHFMLNNVFARRIANTIGKPTGRPGMVQQFSTLIKSLQGIKFLLVAEGGKKYEWDPEDKKLEEVKK